MLTIFEKKAEVDLIQCSYISHLELTINDGQTVLSSSPVDHHQPLDSSPAKHKLKLSRQRTQSKGKIPENIR